MAGPVLGNFQSIAGRVQMFNDMAAESKSQALPHKDNEGTSTQAPVARPTLTNQPNASLQRELVKNMAAKFAAGNGVSNATVAQRQVDAKALAESDEFRSVDVKAMAAKIGTRNGESEAPAVSRQVDAKALAESDEFRSVNVKAMAAKIGTRNGESEAPAVSRQVDAKALAESDEFKSVNVKAMAAKLGTRNGESEAPAVSRQVDAKALAESDEFKSVDVKAMAAKLGARNGESEASTTQQQHGAAAPANNVGAELSVKEKVAAFKARMAASNASTTQQQHGAAAPANNVGAELSVKEKVAAFKAHMAASNALAAQHQPAPAQTPVASQKHRSSLQNMLGAALQQKKASAVPLPENATGKEGLATTQTSSAATGGKNPVGNVGGGANETVSASTTVAASNTADAKLAAVGEQIGEIKSEHSKLLPKMNELFGEQKTQATAGTAQPSSHDQVQSGQVNPNATKFETQMAELMALQQQTALDAARVQAEQGKRAVDAMIMEGITAQMRRIDEAIKALGQLG
ncbi:hypothetical protein [Paraherbaspirillum soli]|uniref:Effector protein BipC n=1 Tax=Paraherbaspirillum soli TaxID=631222 RepID=A0ABW0MAH5_9BURK